MPGTTAGRRLATSAVVCVGARLGAVYAGGGALVAVLSP